MAEMQDLNKRIEMVKAKELLGIPLNSSNSNCRGTQVSESKTEYATAAAAAMISTTTVADTASSVDVDVNIALLKEIKKLRKQLDTAKNEKATNLQIRKIVDRLPGAHYQLDEKVSILNALIDLAGVIYKGRYGLEVDDDRDIPVKDCEGHYNLGKVVETVESLIRKF